MNEERMVKIAQEASQLNYAEWCKVRHSVEKAFASAQSRVKLEDPEAAVRLLKLEM